MSPTTAAPAAAPAPAGATPRALPPVLGRLLSGTFWLAVRTPLQVAAALWTIPLTLQAVGADAAGAYGFAWGFGFLQFLLEFGMSSALQRQVSERWTGGDRAGVDRAVACGMVFYAAAGALQAAVLLAIAYLAMPHLHWRGASYDLIVKLLWLQAVTAPCYGLSVVASSVLQAARRYDFVPRFEVGVVVLRFLVLYVGVNRGYDFFHVVVAQTLISIGLTLVPALVVAARELGHLPGFRGARAEDYRGLLRVSFYMALVQLSVVLADKIDTTVLGVAVAEPGPATAVYMVVSKPFLQIRQVGWMLAYLVMPAVASLVAAGDRRALDRLKYDGTRLHVAALLPVGLLAWAYAGPFLTLYIGDALGYDAAREAPLLRLFLVAAVPLVLAVPVQAAFGMNKPKAVALAALGGSLVNLPLSYVLTLRLGVSGVIWGTVLTTLFSNLLVPGVYVFRALGIRPRAFAARALGPPAAGGVALLAACWALRGLAPTAPTAAPDLALVRTLALAAGLPRVAVGAAAAALALLRWAPLLAHLTAGCLAYAAGYLATRAGRGDLVELLGRLRRRA